MENKLLYFTLFLIINLSIAVHAQGDTPVKDWIPQKLEPIKKSIPTDYSIAVGTIIHFSNGVVLKSELVRMRYIGQLKNDSSVPYLIFSANRCYPCDENAAMYILKPNNGALEISSVCPWPSMPGEIYSFGPDSKIVYRVRLFYGNCLEDHKQVVVWFISAKQTYGKWKDSVYIAETIDGNIKSYFLESPLPDINDTLLLLQNGNCREVPGQKVYEEP